jgi:hypothetical protein
LWHAFIALTLIGAFLGCTAWSGLFGAVLFGTGCGLALLLVSFFKRDRRCAILGGVLTFLCVGTLVAGSTVARGSGSFTLPCVVHVLDESGNPINSANVRIREAESLIPVYPVPAAERGVSGITDANGSVTIPYNFSISSQHGLFVGDETHVLIFRYLWIQVGVTGHQLNFFWQELQAGNLRLPRGRYNP